MAVTLWSNRRKLWCSFPRGTALAALNTAAAKPRNYSQQRAGGRRVTFGATCAVMVAPFSNEGGGRQ
jgi:hypothetical protein